MNFLEAIKSLKKTKKNEIKDNLQNLNAIPALDTNLSSDFTGDSSLSTLPSDFNMDSLKDAINDLPQDKSDSLKNDDFSKDFSLDLPPLEPLDLPPLPPDMNQNFKQNNSKGQFSNMSDFPDEVEISSKQFMQQLIPPRMLENSKNSSRLSSTMPPPPLPPAKSYPILRPQPSTLPMVEKAIPLPMLQPQKKSLSEAPAPKFSVPRPIIRPEQLALENDFTMERSIDTSRPRFVRVTHYSDIFSNINDIRKISLSTEQYSVSIHELSAKKAKLFYKWQDQLEDIQRMFIQMDKSLFEQED